MVQIKCLPKSTTAEVSVEAPVSVLEDSTAAAAAKSLQSCPTLCDPMDCSLPGSSSHGIFQVRVLEWVAIAFSDRLEQCVPIHGGPGAEANSAQS